MQRRNWAALAAFTVVLGLAASACQPTAEAPATGDEAAAPESAAETSAPAAEPETGAVAPAEGPGSAAEPLVMSFVPSGETEQITAGADEIARLLTEETGLAVETNVATSYAAVIEAMGAGNAHVAWLPTLSYILAHEKYGVEPILVVGRFGTTSYASQIIARADSGITGLADLAGKKFCRPDALSTSGWVVPSVMLAGAGVPEADLGEVIDAKGHDAVVTAVYNGDCDAGATFVDARSEVEETLPDVMDQVVVIGTSAEIPNDNVSVMVGLPPATVAALTAGLQAIAQTDAGLEALKTAYGVETLEPADDSFYDAFRVTLDQSGIDLSTLVE